MSALRNRWRTALFLATAALPVLAPARDAAAQIGIGLAYPGVPFFYYTPQYVPSPTDYIYQYDLARMAAAATAIQQDAAVNEAVAAYARTNAYYNHVRDWPAQNTSSSAARHRAPQRRAAAATPAPAPPPIPSPPGPVTLPLDCFFLPSGEIDWPMDAPAAGGLALARDEAALAVKAVRAQVHAEGKAQANSIDAAKTKLVLYGQQALSDVKSARSLVVADGFHSYLLQLYRSLEHSADADKP